MICPQCGEELKENARFCSSCGLSFSSYNTPSERSDNQDKAQADTILGQVLDGKYLLLERLGVGGMGIVYRARRVHIGDEVAVKVLHKQFVADASMLERFRREARAAAQLRHPNIVSIIDLSEARGADAPAYIVMELIEGESLRELLLREKSLAPERAVSLMRDICAGVGAAHRKGIFHRDLKPDNVIVLHPDEDRERETVKVVDFGIAKLRDAAGVTTLTQTGMVMGTPYYMSPEQCRGESLDARADVYSLGAILYEMLAGEPPFTAETPMGLITRHLFDEVPPLPKISGVNSALESVIMRSLSKDREQRQRDAAEFARELHEAMQAPAVTLPAQTIAAHEAQSVVQPEALPPTEVLDANAAQALTLDASAHAAPVPTIPAQVAPSAATIVVSILLVLSLIIGLYLWGLIGRGRRQPVESSAMSPEPITVNKPAISPTPTTSDLRTGKNRIGMEFVLIPAGSFMMGSENGSSDEKPVHRVTINYQFYMGKYEVTQAQWKQVMGSNPSYFNNCEQCPVEMVSWDDTQEFIRTLNKMNDGYTYRLPSEAEWEYAARAGTTGDFAGILDSMAWYGNNSGRQYLDVGEISRTDPNNYDNRLKANGNQTHLVGQKQANGFGLYDVLGNVWEWCEDLYHYDYNGAPSDGSAWINGGGQGRITRGGTWYATTNWCRLAARLNHTPDFRNSTVGFRVVAVARTQ